MIEIEIIEATLKQRDLVLTFMDWGGMTTVIDWNTLMPVVKKVNKICSENGRELSNHSRDQEKLTNQCYNPKHWRSWSYHYIKLSTDINTVFLRVIEFILWYSITTNPPKI